MSTRIAAFPTIAAVDRPGLVEGQWAVVERCPACGSEAGNFRVALPDRNYVFGHERIPLPETGIAVIGCGACELFYKSAVPARAFLLEVFKRQASDSWAGSHDFSDEVASVRRLTGETAFDLIDVGAAGGEWLKACAESGVRGRRSALDVMRFPGIESHLAGEFIEAFLDDPSPAWSREPYDVATLFDVLEHLYQPQIAFENLRSLVGKGGLVLVETGDAGSFWPRRFGIGQWWYVRLFEHHVFWSRRSFETIAAAHGFEIVHWGEGRHKSRRDISLIGAGTDLLKVGLYCIASDSYAAFARLFGKQGNQPWHPFAKDHFRACLKRK